MRNALHRLQSSVDRLQTNDQVLSLTDQLNLGVRMIEMDTHWVQVRSLSCDRAMKHYLCSHHVSSCLHAIGLLVYMLLQSVLTEYVISPAVLETHLPIKHAINQPVTLPAYTLAANVACAGRFQDSALRRLSLLPEPVHQGRQPGGQAAPPQHPVGHGDHRLRPQASTPCSNLNLTPFLTLALGPAFVGKRPKHALPCVAAWQQVLRALFCLR